MALVDTLLEKRKFEKLEKIVEFYGRSALEHFFAERKTPLEMLLLDAFQNV